MRVIVVNPDLRIIEAREIEDSIYAMDRIIGGNCVFHGSLAGKIPDHDCHVDENGVTRRKKVWWFDNQAIWGTMIIAGRAGGSWGPAKCSVEQVRPLVRFEPSTLD